MSSENRANRAEINRLNKAIAEEEQNINAIFQRMGQIYFATHQDAPETAQKECVTAVQMAMNRAKQYKDQINFLRGIALCPSCRAEVSINAAFCSCCGTRMPPRTLPNSSPEARICPNCGNRCAPGTHFCSQCGTRLPEPAAAAVPQGIPVVKPNPFFQPDRPARPVTFAEPTTAPVPTPETAAEPVPTPEPAAEPVPSPVPTPEQEPVSEELTPVEAATDRSSVSAPEPEPAPVLPAKKVCPQCGTELDPEYRFCLECGAPVM